jgi:hypothetical protein
MMAMMTAMMTTTSVSDKNTEAKHQRQNTQTFSNLKQVLGQVGIEHHHRNGSDNQSTERRQHLRAPTVCAWGMEPNCGIEYELNQGQQLK